MEEQKENINKTIAELTDLGWSGEAKDKFMEKHIKNQEFYTNLIEDIKYVKNALENEEKPRALRLKKQSEDFVNCIKRSGGGAALTNDDTGVISLQYGGQFQINNNVSECIDNYKKMNSKFEEILNLANSLSFTSFPIADDVLNLQNSLKNQTTSLTEFNDSFNAYCNGVRDMEENICSVFSKISGITVGISEFRGVSATSENGQVDKNKVMQLMLKNPKDLTNGEKELLSYVEKVLGKDEYAELKELAMFDKIATSPKTSGVVGAVDKSIGIGIESTLGKEMSFNDLNEELKKLGYNHSYRRNLLRDIPKEARDIKVAPELPKGLKLAKGFGVASTVLAGVTAYEDCKNNDTGVKRAEAIVTDGAFTGAAFTGAAYGLTTAAVGIIAATSLPAVAAVGIGIGVAGLIGFGASWGATQIKGLMGAK